MRRNNYQAKILEILNTVVFPCARGVTLFSERPALEGVHAFWCARDINELLERKILVFAQEKRKIFQTHKEGIGIVKDWAKSMNLRFAEEVDISVGVADVLVYGGDIGIFEIGATRPAKMILILKYVVRFQRPFTVHFWPYGTTSAFVFRNWN